MKPKVKEAILVVDDSRNTVEILTRNLNKQGYRTFSALNVDDAIKILGEMELDLVITDLKMPGKSGLELVKHVRDNYPNIEVIMITGYPSIQDAVKAVKTGADSYLPKPFTEEELLKAIGIAVEKLRKKKKLNDAVTERYYGMIGESKPMQKVYRMISKASATRANVLILGESGTGKELVARAIHYASSAKSAPFVPVNCGGIPGELLESELFGYVKGAFTGANESRAGFFQTADGGTIFLDEISETTLAMQVKLLRVLQDKMVYLLGSRKPQRVDVRIISASNRDISSLVKQGIFREDLYFRLNVISLELPPLREREGDIILLLKYLLNKFSKEMNSKEKTLSDEALQIFLNYYWPGNIRELENMIHRLVIMTESAVINVTDLPAFMRYSTAQKTFDKTLEQVEHEHIVNVLTSVHHNKTKAAQVLGIDRKTLREKLKKHRLENGE